MKLEYLKVCHRPFQHSFLILAVLILRSDGREQVFTSGVLPRQTSVDSNHSQTSPNFSFKPRSKFFTSFTSRNKLVYPLFFVSWLDLALCFSVLVRRHRYVADNFHHSLRFFIYNLHSLSGHQGTRLKLFLKWRLGIILNLPTNKIEAKILFPEIVFPSTTFKLPSRSECLFPEIAMQLVDSHKSTAARSWGVRLSSSSPVIDIGVLGAKQPLLSRSKRRRIRRQKIKLARLDSRAVTTPTLVVSCRLESVAAHREDDGLLGGVDVDARVLVAGRTTIEHEEGNTGLQILPVAGWEVEADELLLVEGFSALNTVDRNSPSGEAPVTLKKALCSILPTTFRYNLRLTLKGHLTLSHRY